MRALSALCVASDVPRFPATDMQYGLAIITSLLTAKLVGDLMNHSFYELLLHFKMFPYLAWEPPHDFQQVRRQAPVTLSIRDR